MRLILAWYVRAQVRLADFDMARRDMLVAQADEALDRVERRLALVRSICARCGVRSD